MPIHIIIDGYNLIRRSKKLSAFDVQDIQLGREALIDMLATYKKIKAHRITVVFDAGGSGRGHLQGHVPAAGGTGRQGAAGAADGQRLHPARGDRRGGSAAGGLRGRR